MAAPSTHRGEMSQESSGKPAHPMGVTPAVSKSSIAKSIDPAARSGKRVFNALSVSSIGLEMGLAVGLGLAAGFYLDKWLGTSPWMLLLWMVLGLVAGFRGVFRAIKRADDAAEEMPLGTLGETLPAEVRRG